MRKRTTGWLLALMLLALLTQGAVAEAYSFPYAGVRLAAQADWTVLLPDALEEQAALLTQLGVDTEVLAADYAANHTVFEAYLPEGIQVSLGAVQTEQTAAWDDIATMTEEQKAYFIDSFTQPTYTRVAWSADHPGMVSAEWTYQSGAIPVSFTGLMTVKQGLLYTLTASGADVEMEALYAANDAVLDGLTFLGMTLEAAGETNAALTIPEAIADDGVTTPIALVDFWPIVYGDTTEIFVRTLPDAEVILRTATDMLRGRADAQGLTSFKVSTRRETAYAYTITAQAEGRGESTMEVTVERQLSKEDQELAYRKTAKQIDTLGYANLMGAPEAYAGTAVTLRGNVLGFSEVGGFPCVLIYTVNPGKGVWLNPVWVMLTEATELAEGDIRTVYGDMRGDTLPYTDDKGETGQAPVIISRGVFN